MTTKTVFYPAEQRGQADHGWLKANHSFSFGSWYNPDMMHFGALRVFNDDTVAPGMGFSTHPHDNMEIITIPLSGTVKHKDSMDNTGIIPAGEVQVMSAGSGVTHSELNGSHTEELKLFQIWIFPNQRNVTPRYDQFKIDASTQQNAFSYLVGPENSGAGTWIHQDAHIHMATLESGKSLEYVMKTVENGLYVMTITGQLDVLDHQLNERDALGIEETEKLTFTATQDSQFIVLEVPMTF